MKQKPNQKIRIAFITAFLALSLAPLVLMPWFGNQAAESSDADVTLKPVFTDGKPDTGFFLKPDGSIDTACIETAGEYFARKFAFRREMVTCGDMIKAGIFGVSGQDGVVCGKNGYLFYKDSFNDFLGRDPLSGYQIASMAYNISLMQTELNSREIDFLFTVAPNKNSLYPELMPSRYRPDEAKRNMTRLRPLLEENKVSYLDLYPLFNDIDDVMYLKGDSHWNNLGASLVADEIAEAVGVTSPVDGDDRFETRKDFRGDLAAMLYPSGIFGKFALDEQIYYDKMAPSMYNERVSVMTISDKTGDMEETDPSEDPGWPESPEIKTVNLGNQEGSLLMIRDSFGNSLAPFMADKFGDATFLNGTPYDIGRAEEEGADIVVFETVERNLDRLIGDAPVISTSDAGLSEEAEDRIGDIIINRKQSLDYSGSLTIEPSDSKFDYTYIYGELDPNFTADDTCVYAALKDIDTEKITYHALFRTTRRSDPGKRGDDPLRQYGCAAYILNTEIPEGSYDLYMVCGKDDSWNVSGYLGHYNSPGAE